MRLIKRDSALFRLVPLPFFLLLLRNTRDYPQPFVAFAQIHLRHTTLTLPSSAVPHIQMRMAHLLLDILYTDMFIFIYLIPSLLRIYH